ncbi:MAG: polymerase subunit gamma/tau [Methylobacteriaceae bacterium]|jgi:DNA polymerase-3 subunit gamma/tau|nr:polymerase subunit gamma/tau [Methylobacteriaceae bacterium]
MTDEFDREAPAGAEAQLFGAADLPRGAASAPAAQAAYRVLARKYRPTTFADLIGQEPMVRTLSNAFELGRIHQAYLLTGVRGVGKTTTARILARAFNYDLPAAEGREAVSRPTIHMGELGLHCQAIIDSRHVDVIEMDAASHTGIDDVREIVENARYRPVSARTKVYIIDEVHMLSKQAFNGLLKTLEEPPEHVKFLFATTEIEKVPVTVRSRCLRFDLRRIETEMLARHLGEICAKEGVAVEAAALTTIARAAEGSVRDALSLLDQAIAFGTQSGAAGVHADDLRTMLGLADRSRVIDLFERVMSGDMPAALALLKEQHDTSADPAQVLGELAEFTHLVTKLKLAPGAPKDAALTEEEQRRGAEFADKLSIPVLTRTWQILLKGLQEVREAPRPLAAADMVLVRIAYAADLPSPAEAIRQLGSSPSESRSASVPAPSAGPRGRGPGAAALAFSSTVPGASPQTTTAPKVRIETFDALVALAANNRDIQIKTALERDVHLVRFEEGALEFALAPGASPGLAQTLMRKLQDWTGTRWMVAISSAPGAPTLREQAEAKEQERRVGVQADPLVRSVLERFPGAEIVAVRSNAPEDEIVAPAPVAAELGDEIAYVDEIDTENDT